MSQWGPLFETAGPRDVEEVLERAPVLQAGPLETIMQQGNEDPALLYILDGRVEILRNGFAIDTSGPGEIVGEMSLFTGRPRVATVRALEDTKFLVLDREAYDFLRDKGNEVAFQLERLVLTLLEDRLRRLDRLIVEHSAGEASPYKKPSPGLLGRIAALFGGKHEPVIEPRKVDPQQVLDDSPLFDGERHAFVRSLAVAFRHEAFAPGTFVCTQGEPGSAMFVVAHGQVDVAVAIAGEGPGAERVHKLATLGPGDAFGLTGLHPERPRMASCIAVEQVDALVLDRDHWEQHNRDSNQVSSTLRRAIIRAFAKHLDGAGQEFLVAVGAPSSPTVAPTLLGARLEHTKED